MRRENTYNHIPVIKKYYDKWTVIGKPIPFLSKNNSTKSGYQTRWKTPCECTCGRRDLIDIQNLMNGRSGSCVICGAIAFQELGKRSTGMPPKLVEAFGEKKSVKVWLKDPRCAYNSINLIYRKLRKGISLEEILTNSKLRKRGATRKLTPAQAIEIYDRANAGERGIDLAIEFKISGSIISEIKTGKAYADVTHIKILGRQVAIRVKPEAWKI